MIPNAIPSVGREELLEISKVFDSGWLGMGSVVFDFEKAIKDFLGARYVIGVNTGTSALHIALDALGVKDKDEVIVPSLTFISTIQVIIACGAKPVFCEVERDTLNIDIEDVKSKITEKTQIIIPVHYGGQPCNMDELLNLSQENSLHIVEDAAHAFGSLYKGGRIGSFGDVTCFSFDPIKNITCGEGGAVVTSNRPLAELIMKKRILGIDKDTWHRYKDKRSWFYEAVTKGYRYHMSNINAAIGLVQLKKLGKFIDKKRKICCCYDEAFKDIKEIKLLKRDYEQIAPFNYVIMVEFERDNLIDYLKEHGVMAGVHYIPNHMHPVFKIFYTSMPVTEEIFRHILTLPLYFDMEESDLSKVIETVKDYFGC